MDRKHRLQRIALVGLVSAVLALTFAAYLKPDMMISLAQQVWSCF